MDALTRKLHMQSDVHFGIFFRSSYNIKSMLLC
jgi:hypothetical protein